MNNVRYRAQAQGVRGQWVDGGLFVKRACAEADASRLAELYDRPVRVFETQVSVEGST